MRKAPRHRKLAMWSALPPYLGGKRRLCPLIFREIDRVIPRVHWPKMTFLDGFLGAGSVSLYAKAQGLSVIATDIAVRSVVIGEALIQNSRVKLTREDVLRVASDLHGPPGQVEETLVPKVFTKAQGRFLDRALRIANSTEDVAKAALFRLLAVRVALLAHPMSQVRGGTIIRLQTGDYESITESCLGQYVDGLRLTRPRKLLELAERINAGVFQGTARVMRQNILDVLPEIQADIAYYDPPYPGVASYEREYKVIDQILEGRAKEANPFSAKDGAGMLDGVFEKARHIPLWVLSLGNAVVGIDELVGKMQGFGRVTKAVEIPYKHKASLASEEKKSTNREFLVVGVDPAGVERLGNSKSLDHASGIDLGNDTPALVQKEPDLLGPFAPAPGSLAGDGIEQSHPTLGDQFTSLRRHPVGVAKDGRDDPRAVGSKPRVAIDGERRLT